MFDTQLRPWVITKPPAVASITKVLPCTVVIGVFNVMSAFNTRATPTRCVSTERTNALFAGTKISGSLAVVLPASSTASASKAALVGANTVNEPVPESVVTKSLLSLANCNAATSSPFHQNRDMKSRLFPPCCVAHPCRTSVRLRLCVLPDEKIHRFHWSLS